MPVMQPDGAQRYYTAVVLSLPERRTLEALATARHTNLSRVMREGLALMATAHGVPLERPHVPASVARE